jgi:hypothetical protein
MVEENTSIMRNDFWDIVLRLEGKSIFIYRWIYKIKHVANGSIEKLKVRFMERGFPQREGVDYEETFSPITGYASIQFFVYINSVMRWRMYQMDVNTTFLNRIIEEEICIEKPYGFEVHGRESHVCRLKKAL